MQGKRIWTKGLAVVGALMLFSSVAGTALADPPTGKGPPSFAGTGRGPSISGGPEERGGPPPWAGVGRVQRSGESTDSEEGSTSTTRIGPRRTTLPAAVTASPNGEILQAFFESHQACMSAFFEDLATFHTSRREIIQQIRMVAQSDDPEKAQQIADLKADLEAAVTLKNEAVADKNECLETAESVKDAALAAQEEDEEDEEDTESEDTASE